jgi:hypothetical protein
LFQENLLPAAARLDAGARLSLMHSKSRKKVHGSPQAKRKAADGKDAQPEARRPRQLSDGQRTDQARQKTILTHAIGPLPILNRLLERMRLQEFLTRHLPDEDGRTKVDTPRVVLLLLRNLLVSREPVYGVAEWARNYQPELFGLTSRDLEYLNDDRVGRCLDRLSD